MLFFLLVNNLFNISFFFNNCRRSNKINYLDFLSLNGNYLRNPTPLNEDSWQIYFDKYKTIPQYKLLNFDMSIQEFKIIFYWEYFHRILARIIGLIFIIPLIFFYFSNRIKKIT